MSVLTQGISTIVILMGLFMCVFVDWEYVCTHTCYSSRSRNNSSIDWGIHPLLTNDDIISDTTSVISTV